MITFAHPALTATQKRLARREAGARANCPVVLIDGDSAPTFCGRSYYWTTPSGKTEIRHPNAYRWPKWYHGSTLRVEVGAEYFDRLAVGESLTSAAL